MKTFKIGDYVRIKWSGRFVYGIIRGEFRNQYLVESLNSESFEIMDKIHQRWVKKNQVF